ncbi:MAG: TonB-dependent receptor plug domain-containing protein [Pseudomonadales bacterium]|nr:TonB-dependent receptor plug domain-containing protein [Pseudomonadales bacterium]
MTAAPAISQDAGQSRAIEEVVVTATKRAVPLQDVAIAVQALTEDTMNDLGIDNFEDYLIQLPGVTAGGSGPGQNTIYIRGLASTTPNLTTAGVAGLAPNVAFYLDEQPLSQPGRNLDVYAADLNRIEVLSGPQGTLFGSSSQAGNVRLITNKPDPSETYGSIDLGTSVTKDGDPSSKLEAVLNLSLADNFAIRGVAYTDTQGGYIDQVAGTRDVSESARFRSAGAVRANGEPVSAGRAGIQAGADLSGVTLLQANARRDSDSNEAKYQGGRLSAVWDIDEDWSVNASVMQQSLDVDGVFFADPELGDMEIERFGADEVEDEFTNSSLTIEGRVGALNVLYAGAFTDRETDQIVDYTDYLFVGQYLPYYICDGSVSYPGAAAPSGVCQAPNLFVDSTTETEVWSHEFRVTTPAEHAVRFTGGLFYSDLELTERNDFTYPGAAVSAPFGAFAPNFPFTTGYRSDAGPFPADVIFRNDVRRTDEQKAAFGEVSWDLSETWSITAGLRWYDIEVDFDGSANSSFCNSGAAADVNAFGTDISDLYNGDGQFTFRNSCDPANHITYTTADINDPATPAPVVGALRAPDAAETDGVIGKFTASWTPTDNALIYATWSEGFRPGLLNRPGGAAGPNGYTVPFALDTDDVVNYEAGWKLDLLDGTLRFNGSVFYVEVENLQTTIFDPSIVNLFFSDNAADAEILGMEGDFIWNATDNLTVSGAVSILDTEITKVLTPTNDVRKGDELAFAPSFQGNLRARYQWSSDSGMLFHVMPHVSYSSTAQSDVIVINNSESDSWVLTGITVGVSSDEWSAELFVENLFDEEAELSRSFVFDRERVSYARPQTIGLRFSYDF